MVTKIILCVPIKVKRNKRII